MVLGAVVHNRCQGPGCARAEAVLVLVATRHGLVALCPVCKAARDRVIQRHFDRRTAQAASAAFWRRRDHKKGMPA